MNPFTKPNKSKGIIMNPIPIANFFLFASAVADLKQNLEEVLLILMLFGFLVGTIRIISGAAQVRRGEMEEGISSIVSGALIAAAPLIMRILFEIFFKGGSTLGK